MLCDLYSTFELYHDLTFFTEQCPCFYDFFPRGSVPFAGVIMDIMKDTDPVVKHGRADGPVSKAHKFNRMCAEASGGDCSRLSAAV